MVDLRYKVMQYAHMRTRPETRRLSLLKEFDTSQFNKEIRRALLRSERKSGKTHKKQKGCVTGAAKILGILPRQLWRYIEENPKLLEGVEHRRNPSIEPRRPRKVKLTRITKILSKVLLQPVTWLKPPTNCMESFKRREINRIGDLVQKSEADLLVSKGFGEVSLQTIKKLLAKRDLSLGMKLTGWPELLKETMEAEAEAQAKAEARLLAILKALHHGIFQEAPKKKAKKRPVIKKSAAKKRVAKKLAAATKKKTAKKTATKKTAAKAKAKKPIEKPIAKKTTSEPRAKKLKAADIKLVEVPEVTKPIDPIESMPAAAVTVVDPEITAESAT